MNSLKFVLKIASVAFAVSAAICAVVVFKEEIGKFFSSLGCRVSNKSQFNSDEYADFADV